MTLALVVDNETVIRCVNLKDKLWLIDVVRMDRLTGDQTVLETFTARHATVAEPILATLVNKYGPKTRVERSEVPANQEIAHV